MRFTIEIFPLRHAQQGQPDGIGCEAIAIGTLRAQWNRPWSETMVVSKANSRRKLPPPG
jgi:hypothetical protein